MAEGGPEDAVAVIDIGSNSGRVVVYRRDDAGMLRILSTTRAPLRLVSDVDTAHVLGPEAIARALDALRDFNAIARGAGAKRIFAVATAAMRDAANGPDLIEKVRRELGIEIQIIDGEREAVYGLRGGISGLPVENGLFFDVGGGSMQVSRFRARRLVQAWSFPLGSLRLSGAFLATDPPTRGEIRALREHVRDVLAAIGPQLLGSGEMLVGTGGTVRNLAKIDRRQREYPITRVHGYLLERPRLGEVVNLLASRKMKRRDEVAGLSGERGDSIVGGGLAIDVLASEVGAPEVLVSGQGVREGLVQSLFEPEAPSVDAVRAASLRSLTARFAGWDPGSAQRRAAVAAVLGNALGVRGDREVGAALARAAHVMDIGRSVDFFDRHEHAARIVLATEVFGFAHREIALTAAVIAAAGDADDVGKALSPLVQKEDRAQVEAAGVILALADDIVERTPPDGVPAVDAAAGPAGFVVTAPGLGAWRARKIDGRFERVFGMPLTVRVFDSPGGGP
jgi:exopolyphosphatase/guanosine-5'-triphosphate,3'-diphosphate pyrophosphatase